MTSSNGNKIANQFIITDAFFGMDIMGKEYNYPVEYFQSYDSIIARKVYKNGLVEITLDKYYWNYSVTTGKYRNIFLDEDKKTTEKKIASGEYKLANLN